MHNYRNVGDFQLQFSDIFSSTQDLWAMNNNNINSRQKNLGAMILCFTFIYIFYRTVPNVCFINLTFR